MLNAFLISLLASRVDVTPCFSVAMPMRQKREHGLPITRIQNHGYGYAQWVRGKDGNGADSDRVKSMCFQTQNPKSKSETAPNIDSDDNPSLKPNPRILETCFLCQHNNNKKDFL